MNNFIPTLDKCNKMMTGSLIESLDYCMKNSYKGKCALFYMKLKVKGTGFYTCPHGMSVYLFRDNGDETIYSCFREKVSYDKLKAKYLNIKEKRFNPLLEREQFLKILETQKSLLYREKNLKGNEEIVHNVMHDVKKLNTQVKGLCESIWNEFSLEGQIDLNSREIKNLFDKIKTITVCSSMMYSSFSMYDYTINPKIFVMGAPYSCNVYKKFDKVRQILKNYLKKNVVIKINGNSYFEFFAFASFEIVPLLLLENAVKYSPKNSEVNVDFDESTSGLAVKIESVGPYCDENEIKQIFNKGFRGKNAIKVTEGCGLGMYFVSEIVKLHNIKVVVSSDYEGVKLNKVEHGKFQVYLYFEAV